MGRDAQTPERGNALDLPFIGVFAGIVIATAPSSLVFFFWTLKALIGAAKAPQNPSAAP